MSLLARVAAHLRQQGSEFAVIGAAALAVHGIARSTQDLDLLVTDRRCLDPIYYEAQQPRPRPASTDPTRIARGQRLAELHYCASVHRPGFTGQQQVPRLAGQDYAYLLKLLRGFKARTASDLDGTMTIAAQSLTDEDILNLVHFLASLGSQP